MKNRRNKEFRGLRRKLFLRTAAMLIIAPALIYGIYILLLRGNFANLMLSLLQNIFGMDSAAASGFYNRVFRRHMDSILLLSMLLVFLSLFQVYLRWFTEYFDQISKGMDAILQGTPGEISLAPELFLLERKMNAAKHTLDQQKNEMLLAEQKKSDLMMYLAHDLKTPLASSISYLHLLLDEKEISPKLREKYLSISLSKAERLEELIQEFLEIAKYHLSTITLQYREINLTRLLEQLVYEFQPALEKKNLTCCLEAPEELMLSCDPDKLQRVFDNLLRNALIYSREGTELSVRAEREENGLILKFSNQGDTIPKEKLERIFEQFYRLDTGRDTQGTGLGLAIAKQLVTLHQGTLTAESVEGVTVFTVSLPHPAEN